MKKNKNKEDDDFLDFPFNEKCDAILLWAEENKWFDTQFVKDIYTNANNYQRPSHGQVRAINNILIKFKINVEEWK